MLYLYKMYEAKVGHFCPYSIVYWDKYVQRLLKTHIHNQCQKTHFAINNIFLANVALFPLFRCDMV